MEMFPRKGSGRFRRIDLEGEEWERSMRTLEALASGYTHITNAVFATEEWMVRVDLLLREGDKYTPIIGPTTVWPARMTPRRRRRCLPIAWA